MPINALEQLRKVTNIVADTGDIELINKYNPSDATTNPSLILKAAKDKKYFHIVQKCIKNAKDKAIDNISMDIIVSFGIEILKAIDGRVSSEVDARLSYDTNKTVEYARKIIKKYDEAGVSTNNVLIKIAATWEGIKAAEILEKEDVNCNLTLIFDENQALACAESNVFLISPFVGRITDWQISNQNLQEFPKATDDMGVNFVKNIYKKYKEHGYKTIVMGASFRNIGQVKALAGCDALTISPVLLEELTNDLSLVNVSLVDNGILHENKFNISHEIFKIKLKENIMADSKLKDGIKQFSNDIIELENIIKQNIG